jgi:hypothetical protein
MTGSHTFSEKKTEDKSFLEAIEKAKSDALKEANDNAAKAIKRAKAKVATQLRQNAKK